MTHTTMHHHKRGHQRCVTCDLHPRTAIHAPHARHANPSHSSPVHCAVVLKNTVECGSPPILGLIYPPNPYRVRPAFFNENTTSNAVTVFLRPCSVYVTASLIKFSRNSFSTDRVSS